MSRYSCVLGAVRHGFEDLRTLLARASAQRSGDELAGVAAASHVERVAARFALADVPLKAFLQEALIPYESDEVTRLIQDAHQPAAFAPVSHMTVGDFRDWLLSYAADAAALSALAPGSSSWMPNGFLPPFCRPTAKMPICRFVA